MTHYFPSCLAWPSLSTEIGRRRLSRAISQGSDSFSCELSPRRYLNVACASNPHRVRDHPSEPHLTPLCFSWFSVRLSGLLALGPTV